MLIRTLCYCTPPVHGPCCRPATQVEPRSRLVIDLARFTHGQLVFRRDFVSGGGWAPVERYFSTPHMPTAECYPLWREDGPSSSFIPGRLVSCCFLVLGVEPFQILLHTLELGSTQGHEQYSMSLLDAQDMTRIASTLMAFEVADPLHA